MFKNKDNRVMKKKTYMGIMLAGLVSLTGGAQEQLKKEITLDKDFVPVEKKAVKKSALPKVLKPVKSKKHAQLNYSNWAQPTAVSTEIPTMLPYGYRTSHIFSNKRGYINLGAGTQLNMTGSLGYRFVDDATFKVSGWLQHNSTWSGKNSTRALSPLAVEEEMLKQQFNDNVVGLDLEKNFSAGTLNVDASVHVDNFNYYRGAAQVWNKKKQTLLDANVAGAWNGHASIADHELRYDVALKYNHAGYNRTYLQDFDGGAKENYLKASIGGNYALNESSAYGLDASVDYLNRKAKLLVGNAIVDNMTMISLSPYYATTGDHLTARLGAMVNFSFGDGAKIRLAPQVKIDYEVTSGFSIFAHAGGGKWFNTIASMAALNRYSDPMAGYENSFSPVDAEFGFNIGPFYGFKARLLGGYGMFKHHMVAYLPSSHHYQLAGQRYFPLSTMGNSAFYAPVYYKGLSTRGYKVGAELSYQYRSLVEVSLKGVYSPQDKEIDADKTYSGYLLGLDMASYVIDAGVKVNPIKPLSVNVGLEYRGKRRAINEVLSGTSTTLAGGVNYSYEYSWLKMKNVCNLTAGASYRFDKSLTLWLQAANLLNRRHDILYGMGAQRLSVMGGIGFVF